MPPRRQTAILHIMDFDWIGVTFDLTKLTPKDIEESFEDPFSMKLLPDDNSEGAEARYYNLGKSLGGRGIFSVFWTDGKRYRVIFALSSWRGT